ncbi:hypothetical protein KCP69_05175 [Salmonella enterica subsp. enterica]|nr:hypothetical protein KCP69_05175 [Salmonella enterica subsp. enterica]
MNAACCAVCDLLECVNGRRPSARALAADDILYHRLPTRLRENRLALLE